MNTSTRKHLTTTLPWLFAALVSTLCLGCNGQVKSSKDGHANAPGASMDGAGNAAGGAAAQTASADAQNLDQWTQVLALREVNYSAALREASLRLTGNLPSLSDIKAVADAGDKAATYNGLIHKYITDPANQPALARQIIRFFRDTLRMGPLTAQQITNLADIDTAPAFGAQLVIEDSDFTQFFTATAGNCPTFDETTGAFTSADCANNVPAHAGVLTNTGFQAQYFSNLAMRRVRAVQELFVCSKMPAEVADAQDVGGAEKYTNPWPFMSISGLKTNPNARVDFHDVKAVVCANCHGTMNHIAPLFANFDAKGVFQNGIQVKIPTGQTATRLDWLPAAEGPAWRFGKPVGDLPALGAAIAADPAVQSCIVARFWNWAFGKGDIVSLLTVVPPEVMAKPLTTFTAGGFKVKAMLETIFTSDDFVRY